MLKELPPELEPYRADIIASSRAFIRIRADRHRETRPWESKIGGVPYQPKAETPPLGSRGQPLHFLAQLNFAEMPPLSPFPDQGIVVFYIDDAPLFGFNPDDSGSQSDYRVLFFPEVIQDADALRTDHPLDRPYEYLPHHPEQSFPLLFEPSEEVAPVTDYHFWERFGQDFFQRFGTSSWDVLEAYEKLVRAEGHKVGGYAYFTQDDPRTSSDPHVLLFQLDSDQPMDLMWGDTGVAHFFIREKDLRDRRFSSVWFNWDCM
jgi:uncharacterized protein YwqG